MSTRKSPPGLSKSNKSPFLMPKKVSAGIVPTDGTKGEVILGTPLVNKQISCAKHWVFTLNNATENDWKEISSIVPTKVDTLVMQEEIGDEGTPHIQGCLSYITKERPFGLKLNKEIHWEKKSKKSTIPQMRNYACDPGKRKEGGRVYLRGWRPTAFTPLKIIEEDNFYKWQKTVKEIVSKEPDDRDIHWIRGGYRKGKTAFCKYLVNEMDAIILSGCRRHMLFVAGQYKDRTIFIVHLCKGDNKVSYKSIEEIKDGLFMSHFGTKGTYPVIMNPPHILIFSNEIPDFTDRNYHPDKYKQWFINEDGELEVDSNQDDQVDTEKSTFFE